MATWLDRTIGWFSPAMALQREQYRAALKTLRSYEAASTGRKATNWRAAGTDANAAATTSLATVRNRARDLVRNNPHAAHAIDVLTSKSVGTGIRARFPKGPPDKVFKAWARRCDYHAELDVYGIQSLSARTAFESGSVLVRRVWDRDVVDGIVPIRLQILEPDYLDTLKFETTKEGNVILGGIELDPRGRRVAYWLFDSHPGEVMWTARNTQSRRVDAADVLYFYEKRRPGQMHAVSRLAASMPRFRDHDEYREAIRVKKKIEACFVAFVHGGGSTRPLGEGETDPETGVRTETMSPGIIEYLNQGEDVKFGSPSPGDDDGYSAEELRAIAMGAGVTYEQLTGDLRSVNLSSIRSGMQDFRDMVETWRWIYFVPMFCQRIEAWYLEAGWTAGLLRSRNYEAIWTPPRWPYMQPVDDIEATKEEIRAGLSSTAEKLREFGYDPIEVEDEIAEERKRWKEKGIAVDTDPATMQAARRAKSSKAADEAGDAKSGAANE